MVWTVWDGMDGEQSPNHSHRGHGDGYDGVRGDGDALQAVPEGVGSARCAVDDDEIALHPADTALLYCDDIATATRGGCAVSDICSLSICGKASSRGLCPYSVAVMSSGSSGRHLASRTLESDGSGQIVTAASNERMITTKA